MGSIRKLNWYLKPKELKLFLQTFQEGKRWQLYKVVVVSQLQFKLIGYFKMEEVK